MAEETPGITEISVAGFKSIEDESIEIRPLTILAGANSSGKSSIMQPMLLMKQTLDATYDPAGPLLLYGPHVQFTRYEQFLPHSSSEAKREFSIGYKFGQKKELVCNFMFIDEEERQSRRLDLTSMNIKTKKGIVKVKPRSQQKTIAKLVPSVFRNIFDDSDQDAKNKVVWRIETTRCFFGANVVGRTTGARFLYQAFPLGPVPEIEKMIENLIHLPGLRGNPERTYRAASAHGSSFQGPFQHYTASIISRWQEENDDRLELLGECLRILNLTSRVSAKPTDDVNVELLVGRLLTTNESVSQEDIVSIADVGIGVSQILPVLVALLVAKPGQMVYVEQPELHLHPFAQVELAEILASAAERGVRVVIETHSSLLLREILTQVAKENLEPEDVMLHWFQRDKEGKTEIRSVVPDEDGAYGDWPNDFDYDFANVEMSSHRRYLKALAK